jgi:hypothetical protein
MSNWFNNIFKKKEQPFNIYHPDMQESIEFAFEAGPAFRKVKYYRAKKDIQLPVGRYKWIDARLYEAELRMNINTLNAYMDTLEKYLGGSTGAVVLSKAFEVIWAIRTRLNLAFEPETIERLAAVVFFDETEILNDFDEAYGEKKIKFWKEHNVNTFFLTTPISELLNLIDISETSLREYIRNSQEVLKDLTFVAQPQSSETT